MSTTATPGDAVTGDKWYRWRNILVRVRPDGTTKVTFRKDTDMYNPKGLDIACAVPSRTHREEPIMDKIRFAETLDVQDPELQLLSFTINEEFYDAVRVLMSMSPKDRAILSFHLEQLRSMVMDANMKDKPWRGTGV